MDIILTKINESHLKIDTNRGILQELTDHFSFFVDGYQWMPKYKRGLWDGKIRLFSVKDRLLPVGLFEEFKTFCKSNSYKFESSEDIVEKRNISDDWFDKYLQKLKPKYVPRDFQWSAFKHAIRERRAGFLSPTASGKSFIIYLISRFFMDQGKNVLIIVPTTSLVYQMNTDFADYNNGKEFDSHCIMAGVDKSIRKNLTISTWQSLYKLPKEWFDRFDCVIGDEAHLFQANSLVTIMNNCINAADRFAFTGTLNGTKTHQLQIEALFGKFIKVITTKELMERGDVSQLKIKNLLLQYPEEICKLANGLKYAQEIALINSLSIRNKFIGKLVNSIEGNTIIFFKQVENHGEILFKYLQETYESDQHKFFFVSGKVGADAREEIRKFIDSNSGHKCTIVASLGTMSTGVNMKQLQNLIFASPNKSIIKVLQSIGRLLRLDGITNSVTVYDLVDDFRYKKHVNYAMKHYMERVKIYANEKFTFKNIPYKF